MKLLTALIFSLTLVGPAFGKCSIKFEKPEGYSMAESFINNKTYERILKILDSKGYEVVNSRNVSSDFELRVQGEIGYGCGTGLTFRDYLVTPVFYAVKFSMNHGNIIYEKEESFSRPILTGTKLAAKRSMIKAIKQVPACL